MMNIFKRVSEPVQGPLYDSFDITSVLFGLGERSFEKQKLYLIISFISSVDIIEHYSKSFTRRIY